MKKIDDIVKNELENSGIPFKEAYWTDMEILLDQKKKTPIAVYFTLVALALLIGISALVLVNDHPTSDQKEVAESFNTMESSPLNTTSSKSANDREETPKSALQNHSKPIHHDTPTKFSPSPAQVHLYQAPKIVEIGSTGIEMTTPNVSNIAATSELEREHNVEPSVMVFQEGEESIADQPEIIRASILQFPYFVAKSMDSVSFNRVEVQKDNSNDLEVAISSKKQWGLALAPYIGFNLFSNGKSFADINTLKTEEKLLNTKSFGLHLVARKNRIAFSTGLGINQFSIQSNYSSLGQSYSYDTSYKLVNGFYGQTVNGTRIALIKQIVDTTAQSYTVVNNPNKKSAFTYLQIPFTVRYTFPLKRFDVFIEPGINSQFLMQSKGLYVGSQNQMFDVRNADDRSDLNQVIFGGSMHVGIQFRVYKRLSMIGSYGYTQSFHSMYKSYQQKQSNTQFKIGLEFGL